MIFIRQYGQELQKYPETQTPQNNGLLVPCHSPWLITAQTVRSSVFGWALLEMICNHARLIDKADQELTLMLLVNAFCSLENHFAFCFHTQYGPGVSHMSISPWVRPEQCCCCLQGQALSKRLPAKPHSIPMCQNTNGCSQQVIGGLELCQVANQRDRPVDSTSTTLLPS